MPGVQSDFAQALARHREWELQQAEAIYRAVLARDPRHADALHLLGLIASENGNHQTAAALIVRAIQLQGPEPVYCANLGVALSREGKFDQAIACYRQALRSNPSDAETWARLGRAQFGLGRFDAATEAFEQSIGQAPGEADVHYELATVFRARGLAERAEQNYRRALELHPAFIQAHFELGNLLYASGRHAEAAACYGRTTGLQPGHAEAWYNLGVACTAQERLPEALKAYREALRWRPAYAEAHNNLGVLLQAYRRLDEAVREYREAIASAPGSVDARYNLGLLLQERGELDEAAETYEQLLERKPDHTESINNLGNVLLALGHPEEAMDAYWRALTIDPVFAEARWNIAVVQLLLGRYQQGWRGYEWRFRQKHYVPRPFDRPLWDRKPLNGRRILLHAEQGLGDTLQFIRYAPLVKALDGVVIVECQEPLVDLLATAPGIDERIARGETYPDYDCQAPLLSLPHLLGTTLATIPHEVPYLKADPDRVERWGKAIKQHTGKAPSLRVGLTWSGNPDHKMNRFRSLDRDALRTLENIPGVTLFALQKGEAALAQAASLNMVSLESPSTNLCDTAAIVANLDLIVSVDTSIAHLGGALGKPVWTLLAFAPDWRWLLDREDCPWYPSMRLFRQSRRGDWSGVMARVRAALVRLGWEKQNEDRINLYS
ncbi:MAG: tetratricopeptide repeat protein [Bryobacteraceae bacterium]